ncbi:MAG: sulfurtransferase TusA family protein [Pseudomonadota bacterium]
MQHDAQIDALGLLCPLPVLKAAKKMREMAPGEVLCLLADDPAAAIDVPHYCAESGNAFLGEKSAAVGRLYFIKKAAQSPAPPHDPIKDDPV